VNKGALGRSRVLITDDEEDVRRMVSQLMRQEGFEPLEAGDGKDALEIMRRELVDAVILDIRLPGKNGMEVLKEARRLDASMPVILITAFGGPGFEQEAMRNGAYGYFAKPFENAELILAIRSALKRRRIDLDDFLVNPSAGSGFSLAEAMGSSDLVSKVVAKIELVAPTDFTVLIQGETGSGKEMVARAIHGMSGRANGPFVPVDCGSVPPTLIESALFGHEKGSFTGADRVQYGKFEIASGGTLFLDEISNLPPAVQPKLLRALQEKEVWRIGGKKPVAVDIRILAATNQDLASVVQAKRFRRDLYYRLNEFGIIVPPLRQRREDIIFLAKRFLDLTNGELTKDVKGFSDAALEVLLSCAWPGNIRELRNVIRQAVLMADTYITPTHLGILDVPGRTSAKQHDPDKEFDSGVPLKEIVRRTVRQVEQEVITRVLRETHGNKAKAARVLQVDYKTLHTKVKQYGIEL